MKNWITTIFVNLAEWDAVHCTFVVESFFKCGECYARMMCVFCRHFSIVARKPVPSRNFLKLWMENFCKKGTIKKSKLPGQQKSVQTPENIECMSQAFENSPTRSHWEHTSNLHQKLSIVHPKLNRKRQVTPLARRSSIKLLPRIR